MRLLFRLWRCSCNPSRYGHYLRMSLGICRLALLNHISKSPITQAGTPIVSLTTHGLRLRTVYLTIESIARGELKPSRIVLWLDNRASYDDPPATLRRLKQRGLEIKLCSNYGPHTKYYPFVKEQAIFDSPVVTADDDVLYPAFWLDRLNEAFLEHPDKINCYFARSLSLNGRRIGRFAEWQACGTTKPGFSHQALGLSGVIYPPAFLQRLKHAGSEFLGVCPKADDLWLHVQAIRSGYRIRQLSEVPLRFAETPGTAEVALWKENGLFGGNDEQIKATYIETDIDILCRERHRDYDLGKE